MEIKLSPDQFQEIIKKSYSLDYIYFLKMIKDDYDVDEMCKNSERIKMIRASLIRKGLVSEEGKVTLVGEDLLKFISTREAAKIVKRKVDSSKFEEWWKIFPGTDKFKYKGMSFEGSRGLRQDKANCKIKFDKIVLEGDYTAEDIIKGTEYDVVQRKERSIKERKNILTYMQNSLTYLNQRSFDPFVELIKKGEIIREAKSIPTSTDI